jgi:hypothetical protein
MLRLLLVLLLTVPALSQSVPTAPAPAPATVEQENSRKAKEVIDQAIQALGGPTYLSAQDVTQDGRFYSFFHGESNSVGIPYGLVTKYPDKDRFEVIKLRSYHILFWTVGNVPVKDKADIVLIHNGSKGYEITYKGTAAEEPADTATFLRRRQHSLPMVLRQWIHEPGVALFYVGTGVAEGKPAQQVTIVNARNESVTLWVDEHTHLPIKKSYSWRDPSDKLRNVEDEVYDNYKSVQGIMTPHSVTRYMNGDMSNQRFVNTLSYNQNPPDSLFEAAVTYDPKKPQPKR